MDVRDGFLDAIGNTPLIRLRRASEETGCEILGKAEFLNPGSSVKDRAALFIVRDAEERGVLRPGGVDRRGHRRQHRHRPGAGRQRPRLPNGDRHRRHAEPGEDGHAPAVRRRGAARAGGALPRSEQLRQGVRPARRRAGADRAERGDLGQPVRQRRQPARPLRDHRAGDLAADRRQGRRLHLRRRYRRHARRGRHVPQGAQSGRA